MVLLHFYKIFEFWFLRKLGFIKFWLIWKNSIIKYWLFWNSINILIWKYVYIWENCNFWALWWIEIWDWTIIAPNVIIRTSNHDYKSWDYLPFWPWIENKKVFIWKNCWIWANVLIAPWTIINDWCIIWFWTVVSWNIPKCSIVIWNPCKIIKNRDQFIYEKLVLDDKIYYKHFK